MAVKLRYTKPPPPFIGNKSKWVRLFAETVAALPASTVFVDCFGGSGLLSRTAADACPGARVIYNDFDGYADRMAAIPVTNLILRELRELLSAYPRMARIPDGVKAEGLKIIQRYRDLFGEVDEATLTANVAFSSRSIEGGTAEKLTWYNKLRASDIAEAPDYPDSLEVVREDFRALLERYGDDPNAVFILDPPYLSTQCSAYSAHGGLRDSLELLAAMRGKRYIYFSSDKSEIETVDAYMREIGGEALSPLSGARRFAKRVSLATTEKGEVKYSDLMYVRL